MTSNPTLRCRWLSRTFGALFVLVALAGTALDAVPAAARETDETPLDLAAMALTPDDLSSAGLDGYGVGDGGTLAPDAVAAAFAFERDIPADDAADLFSDAGLRGAYELQLDVTARGDSHDASVRSTIHEYPDESGAADAFTGLTDWGSSPADVVTLDAPSIGDEAVVVRLVGTTAGRFHALDLTIRTGRLVASVRLVDFTGSEPAMNDATLLGNRLVARIQEGLDETPVGLGGQALRLSGDGVIPIWDYYTAAGGQPVSLAGQPAGEATTADDLADAGVTAEYEVSQRFATVGTMERDTYFYSYVQLFVDDDAASTYLEGTEDRLADNDEFEGLEQIDGLREYGDESIAFSQTFHWEAQDVDLKYERFLLRVDDKVAEIMLIAPDWMPYGALEDLAAAQATCLSEGACDESTRLPATLASMVEDAQGDTAAPDSDRTFPFPSRTRTYVGPTYGVELTYDTADWSVMLEQTADDMDMLGLYEEGTTSMVTFSSYPAFHAADACVADLTSGFADDEAFGRAKPIRNGSGDPIASDDSELAFAAYGLAIDDGSQTFMYLECRSFADDEDTLLITQVGPLDEYSARASARDDLLSGLTLPAD